MELKLVTDVQTITNYENMFFDITIDMYNVIKSRLIEINRDLKYKDNETSNITLTRWELIRLPFI